MAGFVPKRLTIKIGNVGELTHGRDDQVPYTNISTTHAIQHEHQALIACS